MTTSRLDFIIEKIIVETESSRWPSQKLYDFGNYLHALIPSLGNNPPALKERASELVDLLKNGVVILDDSIIKLHRLVCEIQSTLNKEPEAKKNELTDVNDKKLFLLFERMIKGIDEWNKCFSSKIVNELINDLNELIPLLKEKLLKAKADRLVELIKKGKAILKESRIQLCRLIYTIQLLVNSTLGKTKEIKAEHELTKRNDKDFFTLLEKIANGNATVSELIELKSQAQNLPTDLFIAHFFDLRILLKLLNCPVEGIEMKELSEVAARIVTNQHATPVIFEGLTTPEIFKDFEMSEELSKALKSARAAPSDKRKIELEKVCEMALKQKAFKVIIFIVYTDLAPHPNTRRKWISQFSDSIFNQLLADRQNDPLFTFQLIYDWYESQEEALKVIKENLHLSPATVASVEKFYKFNGRIVTFDLDIEITNMILDAKDAALEA